MNETKATKTKGDEMSAYQQSRIEAAINGLRAQGVDPSDYAGGIADQVGVNVDAVRNAIAQATTSERHSTAHNSGWCLRCDGPVADGGRFCGECWD